VTQAAGVIGSPIGHSLSPAIFTAAFAASGLDWSYDAYEVAEGKVEDFLRGKGAELAGLSVTMPHKADIIPFLDDVDEVAAALQAVNCVVRQSNDRLRGCNTDGAGFLDALQQEAGVDARGKQCVVVGAGGAGRAVALALSSSGASEVVVVNRSASRAQLAVDLLQGRGRVGQENEIAGADVVVNATSVGMGDDPRLPFDVSLLREDQVVVDIVYHPMDTPLLLAAREVGALTVGGLGMLVHQAAHQYLIWTATEPPLDAMWAGARG
jgi:shikimate dehydrogenase